MKNRTEVRTVTYGTVYCMESTYKSVEDSKDKEIQMKQMVQSRDDVLHTSVDI